jgi:hypothetical protein
LWFSHCCEHRGYERKKIFERVTGSHQDDHEQRALLEILLELKVLIRREESLEASGLGLL